MKKNLLFEIGLEEVPARFLPQTIEDLRGLASGRFSESGIPFGEITVFATPRRITLLVEGLPENQPDRVREVFGPPEKIAFDKEKKPSKALEGFARGLGLKPEQLVVKEKNSGRYMVAVLDEKGSPLKDVLPGLLKEIALSLPFPKSMRWGNGNIRFVRPIRWVTSLFDSETLNMDLDGIRSGNVTRGHRFLAPAAFQIKNAGLYEKTLRSNFVIVNQEERRKTILEDLHRLAATVGGHPVMDEGLLNTVVYLVEYPVGMLCEFPKEYLELPEELLVTVMQDHQKYFAIKDDQDRLINHFTVISNTLKENYFVVKAGSERVIRARFEDARFYFHEDRRHPLVSRVEDLKKVAFHERLGSLHDKLMRLEELTAHVAAFVCPDGSLREHAIRAAHLSKSDLVSGVVREFPELQGIMGSYYALADGEHPQVAGAILEQYLPRHTGDTLPSTAPGAALALADRLDNIAAFFHLGLAPTGSEDPFALRRQSIAAAQILIEGGYGITLEGLVDKAAMPFLRGRENAELKPAVLRFFESRLPQIFEARGFEDDIAQALLAMALRLPLKDIVERQGAIKRFKKAPGYNPFLLAIKRVNNILPSGAKEEEKEIKITRKILLLLAGEKEKEDKQGAALTAVAPDPALFREPAERLLFEAISAAQTEQAGLLSEHLYEEALNGLSRLTGPVNDFFDKVLVMDKDEAVRHNRFALLRCLWRLAAGICDFSKLAEV